MRERREVMAEIVSCVTGIPKDRLEEFEPLKQLLEKADNPGEKEERFSFGLMTFRWPCSGLRLMIDFFGFWSNYSEAVRLENLYGMHIQSHITSVPKFFLSFMLADHNLQKAPRRTSLPLGFPEKAH